MTIILKRQDQTSICCPTRNMKPSQETSVKRVEVLIAIGLMLLGVWVIAAFW